MAERSRAQHQQRRAAYERAGNAGASGAETSGAETSVQATVEAAVAACLAGAVRAPRHLVEAVARSGGPDRADVGDPVDQALAGSLVATVAAAWRHGWQPADLHRAVERLLGREHARLAVKAMASEAARHPEHAVPPRWRLQLDAIGADDLARRGPAEGPWAVPWPALHAGDDAVRPARLRAVAVAVETLAVLRSLPPLPKLGPVPGEPEARGGGRALRGRGADPRVIHKVTSLLAKAESTNFPDEAEALTAKAQQLMTRHAIDRAEVDAQRGDAPQVGGRRVGIDDPYAGARHLLLSVVADANRCRAAWSKQWGFATVFGDEGDLDAVELLYTSLLVQATRAMVAEARPRSTSSGATRSFRHSFLVAFAQRVGDRLRDTAASVTADAARRSAALVPVFEQRRQAADDALDQAFPTLGTSRMSARNLAGWQAGQLAADRAQLGVEPPVPAGRRRALS